MPTPYVKRVRLTQLQKLGVIKVWDLSSGITYSELARWAAATYNLPALPNKSTIGRILQSRSTFKHLPTDLNNRKNAYAQSSLELDEHVVEFIMLAEFDNTALNGAMIIEQARRLAKKLGIPTEAQPRFGSSWLRCLQERYGFKWRRAYGESASADMVAAQADIDRLRTIISNYRQQYVYNMDESAFYYNAAPRGSICLNVAPALKQDKSRLTMAVCCNADGSHKLPLLFLGKSAIPRWYPNKPATVQYFGTSRGWMTAWMYQQWLVGVDEEMRAAGRHILLLVDNASSHHEVGLSLTNVRVEKLPPNTTSKIQPMGQGVIYCLERDVLNKKLLHALDYVGESVKCAYKLDMLTAILWCEQAWQDVSVSTIENCWKHTDLIDRACINYILN